MRTLNINEAFVADIYAVSIGLDIKSLKKINKLIKKENCSKFNALLISRIIHSLNVCYDLLVCTAEFDCKIILRSCFEAFIEFCFINIDNTKLKDLETVHLINDTILSLKYLGTFKNESIKNKTELCNSITERIDSLKKYYHSEQDTISLLNNLKYSDLTAIEVTERTLRNIKYKLEEVKGLKFSNKIKLVKDYETEYDLFSFLSELEVIFYNDFSSYVHNNNLIIEKHYTFSTLPEDDLFTLLGALLNLATLFRDTLFQFDYIEKKHYQSLHFYRLNVIVARMTKSGEYTVEGICDLIKNSKYFIQQQAN